MVELIFSSIVAAFNMGMFIYVIYCWLDLRVSGARAIGFGLVFLVLFGIFFINFLYLVGWVQTERALFKW